MPNTFLSKAEQLAKKAEDYPEIFGSINLTNIRQNVGEILKLIGRDGIFREYTLHDANHIDAMLALVDKLIPADTVAAMKTADWLMIVLSCYFHDLGMLVTKKEFESRRSLPDFQLFNERLLEGDKGKDYKEALDKLPKEESEEFLYQEFVRQNHANRIYHWIQGQDAPQYGDAKDAVEAINGLLAGLEQVVRDDLAKICLSHHQDDLFDLDKYQINRAYGDNSEGEANLQYAALILRTADILQIQKKRVPPVLYKLIDPSNPKSQEEWAKQAGVRAVKPKTLADNAESDTIEVHASFSEERAYFGLLAYLQQFAGKELDRCHNWANQANRRGATFRFPWRQIDWSQVEPRGFEGRNYYFQLDQEKILKLLTGHPLYNDSRVAIREVLQNALDAVRFRNHLFPHESMGKIEVIWESKNRKLTVRDNGTGMTKEIIEKFLLNVGSSFYQSEEVLQQHKDFSPISRFGIGVLSTFMIADEVQILTVHPDDEFARQLTLPSVVKSYLIKKIPKGDLTVRSIGSHGTEVVLKIRRSAELKNVEMLVRFWLIVPRCEVTCKTDDSPPIGIGFSDVRAVADHFYKEAKDNGPWKAKSEVKKESLPGIDVAYVVTKYNPMDVWDFAVMSDREEKASSDPDDFLFEPPGICVEGIRVRSAPAGYNDRKRAPWVLANLTGPSAPKTNVVRSDVEQTPEFESALFGIYSLLGNHIQNEFRRLIEKKRGIAGAAWEADFIRRYGLENSQRTEQSKFEQAMANLEVIALEEGESCRAVSKRELDSLKQVWTVDSTLIRNIEDVSGTLGIDLPVEKIIEKLGRKVEPKLPGPRVLGWSKNPFNNMEPVRIHIYPQEERNNRVDICWEKEKPGRWLRLPQRLVREWARYSPIRRKSHFEPEMWIAQTNEVSSECPDCDLVVWRDRYLFFRDSGIPDLVDALGFTEATLHIVGTLLTHGDIPIHERVGIRDFLIQFIDKDRAEELLMRLSLPFERRFGYLRARSSDDNIFAYY